MSPSLRAGTITRLIPARWAASDFSFSPPIGSTWPVSVISPVIATSAETGLAADQRGERGRHRDARPRGRPWERRRRGRGCGCRGSANQSSGSSGASSPAWPRTHESAACADSRITSPSWPVIVSLPAPGIAVASMNRTSPPTGVQASPVATPGVLGAAPLLGEEAAPAEQLAGPLRRDR